METTKNGIKETQKKSTWKPIAAEFGILMLKGFLTGVSVSLGSHVYEVARKKNSEAGKLLVFDGQKKTGTQG